MVNNEKTTFIYALYDPSTNDTRYIGKSNRPRGRYYQHMNIKNKRRSYKISWIKSLLNENKKPYYYIIDEVPVVEWEYWEQYWIEQFKQWGFNLTNLTEGGQGGNGYKHTEKTKKKLSKSHLGKTLTEEHKKKISDAIKEKAKDNPMYNRGEGNKRKPLNKDELHHQYITLDKSMPQLSKYFNVSEKKIFNELKIYNIKKEEGWWLDKIANQYKKTVLQYDLNGKLIGEWEGLVDIENELGYNKTNIANCCRNIIKTSQGYIWRYKDETIDLPVINKEKIVTDYSKIPVNQYNKEGILVKKYKSIKIAAKENKLRSNNIKLCCEGKFNTHKGYIWKYI